ncbi:MAG: hypothetical protein QM762_01630 [Chryseolinea sp.]
MKKTVLAAIAIVFGIALTASAQTATPSINQRQQNQHERIAQGVSSGELTRRETAQSVRDQRHINRTERRAKSDGVVTKRERAHIQHEQNRASRQLRRNKHDFQERPGA